jgi:hypothetical protein
MLTKILKEANCKYSKDVWVRRCQNEEKIVPAFAAQEEQTTTTAYRIMVQVIPLLYQQPSP